MIKCYGEWEYYTKAINNSEGSEKERYLNILSQLNNNMEVCSDETND